MLNIGHLLLDCILFLLYELEFLVVAEVGGAFKAGLFEGLEDFYQTCGQDLIAILPFFNYHYTVIEMH